MCRYYYMTFIKHISAFIGLCLVPVLVYAGSPVRDTLVNLPWQETVKYELYTGSSQSVTESDLQHVPVSDMRK